VALKFSQVVAELIQAVGAGGETEGGENGLMDLPDGPAAHGIAAMQQDLQQPDDAGVMDFEPG